MVKDKVREKMKLRVFVTFVSNEKEAPTFQVL